VQALKGCSLAIHSYVSSENHSPVVIAVCFIAGLALLQEEQIRQSATPHTLFNRPQRVP
jgi:hypothetical protein